MGKKNIVLKNIKLIIVVLILLIAGTNFAQYSKTQHRVIDKYQFPKLPMVPSPKSDPYIVIKADFTLTLRDNVLMDCSKFYPSVSNPYLPNGYPAVIMVHGFGDRKETLEGFANAQASFGYCVYTYSVRGQGNSGGLSNLISITEAQDLMELVNYVKHDQASGLDSSNVLITGGSQGGILPYMANCNGLNVKCIISALSSPEFASSWIENNSIKMTFLWTIDYTPDTAKYSPQVTAMHNWVMSSAADKWDSLAKWVPVGRDFKSQLSQATVPMLLENAWQDKFFNAYGNISTIPFVNTPKRYYFGAVRGHGGEFSTTEDTWHENFFNEWFFYWLFGINNNILTRPIYHYAYTSFPTVSPNSMWTFVHDSSSVWPPPGLTDLKLYFNPLGKLKTTSSIFSFLFDVLNNSVSNSLTMEQHLTTVSRRTRLYIIQILLHRIC
jgi:predicted acyl esterase